MMTSPTAMVTTSTPSIPFRISAGGGGAGLVQSAATVLIVVRGEVLPDGWRRGCKCGSFRGNHVVQEVRYCWSAQGDGSERR